MQIAAALGITSQEPSRPATAPEQAKPKSKRTKDTTSSDSDDDDNNGDRATNGKDEAADDGYEFNLFSTSGPAAKVILEDTEPQGDGGLVRPRPLSFYLAGDISAKEQQQYEYAAVSAEDIVAWSKQRSWGMELPWKVREIKVTRKAKPGNASVQILQEVQDDDGSAAKKRPGKKQRILKRQRTRSKEEKAAEAAKQKLEKEEHLKDKKKRLNRIKKLRKRAKEKEKKLAAGEDVGAGSVSGDSGDESAGA